MWISDTSGHGHGDNNGDNSGDNSGDKSGDTRRLMSIYKVYSIGRTWSWPVMSAPACFTIFSNS